MKKELLTVLTKRYAKTILAAPDAKRVEINYFSTKEGAEAKSLKMKTWPYKVVVKARDENGKFIKGWVLICCK